MEKSINMEIKVGSVVRSIAGRDKGDTFVVLATDGSFVYMADGELRKVDNPKKKKLKHLQGTKTVLLSIAKQLDAVGSVTNAEVRKALAQTGEE